MSNTIPNFAISRVTGKVLSTEYSFDLKMQCAQIQTVADGIVKGPIVWPHVFKSPNVWPVVGDTVAVIAF